MSRVVELFGLPGSGKTALGDAIAGRMAVDGHQLDWRSNHNIPPSSRLAIAARASIRHPADGLSNFGAIVRSRQGSLGQAGRRLLGWYTAQTAIADAPTNKIRLLDEGVLQTLWSIGLLGDLDPVLSMLSRTNWIRPDRVVVLDVPHHVLIERLEQRVTRHSRLDRVDADTRSRMLARGTETMGRLLDWISTSVPEVVVVTTDPGLPLTSDEVTRLLGLGTHSYAKTATQLSTPRRSK